MSTDLLTNTIAPSIGVVFNNGMWLAAFPEVSEALKYGNLGELNPLPFSMAFANTLLWTLYAQIGDVNYFIFMGNFLGIGLGFWYTTSALYLLGRKSVQIEAGIEKPDDNLDTYRNLSYVFGICGASISVAFSFFLNGFGADDDMKRYVIGGTANITAIMYFVLPGYTIKEVISNKDASSISKNMTIANFMNCLCWTIYGLSVNDPFIYGPNLAGLLLTLIQIAVKVYYPSKTSKKERLSKHMKKNDDYSNYDNSLNNLNNTTLHNSPVNTCDVYTSVTKGSGDVTDISSIGMQSGGQRSTTMSSYDPGQDTNANVVGVGAAAGAGNIMDENEGIRNPLLSKNNVV